MTITDIHKYIKENFIPVEDKPGYVWFSRRKLQIISIETLENALKRKYNLSLGESEVE